MDLWTALLDVLILLAAATLLGALCERLRQSAILGYLLAGTLLGPNALDLMPSHKSVAAIAELGVALLLFTIGLEFSWRRLRRIGAIAFGGGTAQVLLTGGLAAGACLALGLGGRSAVAIGAMIALSSTACVLRLLARRAEIDGLHGRSALGILLVQDMAVVPLVLVVTALAREGAASPLSVGWELGRAVGLGGLLGAGLFVVLNYVVPPLLGTSAAARNRDLPILLAIVTAVGAAWTSHELGLSPALGAFVAGLLLAESPFATQIRADVASIRTLFVTLFFSSIGMLSNPAWALTHWTTVVPVVVAIVAGKAMVAAGVVWLFRCPPGHAVATGVCLAQVGEFSFVLAEVARQGRVIDGGLFDLLVAATIATLFLTPYLVAAAPRLATAVGRRLAVVGQTLSTEGETAGRLRGHVIIVGFGPAGRRITEALLPRYKSLLVIVELNRKSAAVARSYGLPTHIGDATQREVLEHLGVEAALAVAVTLPDPAGARQVIEQVRAIAPEATIIARARYHVYRWELMVAGAPIVVDEEDQVGLHMARAVRKVLRGTAHAAPDG
ncbi:MAG: cation:proton antiporter [Phycisphaerae bacterium]